MSKPALITVAILMVAFGSILFAADLALGPIRKDLGLARELIEALDARGWLSHPKPSPDDRVRVRTLTGGGEGRLARAEALGIIVEVRPSPGILATPDGLRQLAEVVTEHVDAHGRGQRRLHWIELAVLVDGREVLRTLIEQDAGGLWRAPQPALPSTWGPARR